MKERIYSHASIAVVFSKQSGEFLFDQYTDTYTIVNWRGRINLIGGNQSPEDYSPRGIWEREILEEFCFPEFSEAVDIPEAPFNERALIAKTLIANATPYKDFLVKIPEVMEFRNNKLQKRGPIVKINTVYETYLDEDIFECVRRNLKEGRRLRSEGGSVLKHIDELTTGRIPPASATGIIMKDYLNLRHLNMPNPEKISALPIGSPRETLNDYLSDFEYEKPFSFQRLASQP